MKKLTLALLTSLSTLAIADDELISRPDVQEYIRSTAAAHGFSEDLLTYALQNAQTKSNIITILDKPSTSRPWHEFQANFVNKTRINNGAKFWRNNAELVDAVSKKYQVSPAVMLAILGAETNYGAYTGSFRIVDALSTIAFNYPRRAEYFQKELTEFFLLAREEKQDFTTFKGSYAGAMGWPQFMPSSFRKYAQDWDGDGKHDIWNNPGDALASVANYLNQHGWIDGGDTFTPVNINTDPAELLADKFNLHYTVDELIAKGVAPISEINTKQAAVLFALETEPGFTQHFLGFNNFYVITRYNKSTLYATAVLQLADEIQAAFERGDDLIKPVTSKAKKK
ncbi:MULTISPECIES: lytic murein transglycosylase B [Deefgea]|uniref:Lytic murein transglycosylase B n=1 Tax=Deefgea chitinilytica TaxID=570276 RepID=A0ABS2C927_9NEIS|nr:MULTISPECIES: lytic murein transglycosylase B [Deefgea]MBM5570649.1 lytic murein transglycosylase B [Deefgea chitinilytica]MBM9887878.1 lytic murein transglycosylase B [Deefgea sp. CFH1-16]